MINFFENILYQYNKGLFLKQINDKHGNKQQ